MTTALQVVAENLRRAFGDIWVVDGVSLQVHAGEIYGLIGPNGSGKTTTFRMLAGLLQPHAGRATICGVDVLHQPQLAKAQLGFSTGAAGLYGRLTVREQLVYFGLLYHVSPAKLNDRIDQLTDIFDFKAIIDRRCARLSTGEKQRVSLARAVLHDPPVLMLDEPTLGLDVLASQFLREYVLTARRQGTAILYSTHYLAEAELLCDRIGMLHHGKILCEGRAEELKALHQTSSLEETFLRVVKAQREDAQAC